MFVCFCFCFCFLLCFSILFFLFYYLLIHISFIVLIYITMSHIIKKKQTFVAPWYYPKLFTKWLRLHFYMYFPVLQKVTYKVELICYCILILIHECIQRDRRNKKKHLKKSTDVESQNFIYLLSTIYTNFSCQQFTLTFLVNNLH